MSPYGRGMASDILSTWHFEGEETLGHGLFHNKDGSPYQTPDWIQVGGESRWIQTYTNNLQATQTQWFPILHARGIRELIKYKHAIAGLEQKLNHFWTGETSRPSY